MLERFIIVSAFSCVKVFSFFISVRWPDKDCTTSEWLTCRALSVSCKLRMSADVAVPNKIFKAEPPRLVRPLRGFSLGKTCWKSQSFVCKVFNNVSICFSSEISVYSFLCSSTRSIL
jgi:hypothetical protein